jgi:hypothetical protein
MSHSYARAIEIDVAESGYAILLYRFEGSRTAVTFCFGCVYDTTDSGKRLPYDENRLQRFRIRRIDCRVSDRSTPRPLKVRKRD